MNTLKDAWNRKGNKWPIDKAMAKLNQYEWNDGLP